MSSFEAHQPAACICSDSRTAASFAALQCAKTMPRPRNSVFQADLLESELLWRCVGYGRVVR